MIKRWSLVLLGLLAFGLIAAGCGDDNNSGDSSTAATQETTAAGDESTADESGGDESGAATGGNEAAVQQCKDAYSSVPNLSSETQDKLSEVCEKAASGDEQAAKDASIEACKLVAQDVAPPGAAQDAAISACDQAFEGTPGQ